SGVDHDGSFFWSAPLAVESSQPAIHVLAMGDADDQNEEHIVANRVHDAIFANPDSPEVFRPFHFQAAGRARIVLQRISRGGYSFLNCLRKPSQPFISGWLIRHRVSSHVTSS